jgi:integrase
MQLGIGTVMPHDFAAYVEKRTKAGKTGSTIRKELSLLSQVYVKARRVLRLYSLENPLKDVEKPPCALPRDRRLDEKTDEEGRLIKYFRERKRGNVEMPYLLVAAIETGLRKSELLRLLWRDIRWGDAPWITVEQARKGRVVRKDKEFRGLPLTSRAVTNFKELRAVQLDRVAGPLPADAPVFTLTVATIDNARAKALKATGITDWRLHDARHEAASRFYVRGLKQEFIRRMLGHRSLKMTEGYQDFLQEEMSEAMKQAEAVVASEEGSPGGESK